MRFSLRRMGWLFGSSSSKKKSSTAADQEEEKKRTGKNEKNFPHKVRKKLLLFIPYRKKERKKKKDRGDVGVFFFSLRLFKDEEKVFLCFCLVRQEFFLFATALCCSTSWGVRTPQFSRSVRLRVYREMNREINQYLFFLSFLFVSLPSLVPIYI